MHPADLETLVDREFRRLPQQQAPRTLLPRVLLSVQEWTLRPWYSRAWFTWPLAWQAVTVAALIALTSAGVVFVTDMQIATSGTPSVFAAATSDVADIVRGLEAMADAGGVLYRTLLAPIVPLASVFLVVMCLACALFGAALNHVVWERALHR